MWQVLNVKLKQLHFQKALKTAKQMLDLWKNLYEGQMGSDVPECDRKSDSHSVFQLYTSEMSDKDTSELGYITISHPQNVHIILLVAHHFIP